MWVIKVVSIVHLSLVKYIFLFTKLSMDIERQDFHTLTGLFVYHPPAPMRIWRMVFAHIFANIRRSQTSRSTLKWTRRCVKSSKIYQNLTLIAPRDLLCKTSFFLFLFLLICHRTVVDSSRFSFAPNETILIFALLRSFIHRIIFVTLLAVTVFGTYYDLKMNANKDKSN